MFANYKTAWREAKQQFGKRESFLLWNTLNVKFCPRTSWKNTMANGTKNNRFQKWVMLEKASRYNNVNNHDNLMRKSRTILGKYQVKWSEKQLLSFLSRVRKIIATKHGIRLWQPNEEINKLVRKKKCLNGTKTWRPLYWHQMTAGSKEKQKSRRNFPLTMT